MTASSPHELATLRARAYGPRADIDDDPPALARLRELEAAERATRRDVDTDPAAEAADEATPESLTPGEGEGEGEGAGADEDVESDAAAQLLALGTGAAPASPRPISPAWIIAWAASVLVVALVVGGIVFGLASIRPVSTATGATQVASLTDRVEAPGWLNRWFGGGAADDAFAFRFHGLIIVRTAGEAYGVGTGGECLFVADEGAYNEQDDSMSGQLFSDCGIREFPATVQFVVDSTSAEPLREAFGDGTALQFVLDGDVVGVFESPMPSPAATTAATAWGILDR